VHSTRSLRRVSERSTHPDDREHVGSRYFAEHPEEFRIIGLSLPLRLQDNRWRPTVDEERDYRLMARIYQALWTGEPIPLERVVEWLEAHPEEAAVNRALEHRPLNKEPAAKRSAWRRLVKEWVAWEASASQ